MITRGVFLAILCSAWFMTAVATSDDPIPAKEPNRVTLVIDYGDGVQKHFTAIAWKEGLTVLEVMRTAQAHPRGIRCEFQGSGATTLLTKIDDLSNEGRGRNWLYRVNGKLADTGVGVRQLAARDSVLWKFEEYR